MDEGNSLEMWADELSVGTTADAEGVANVSV